MGEVGMWSTSVGHLTTTPHSAYMYARLDPTHDAGKKDRQKEAPTHTTNTHTHTHICTHYRSPQISLSRLEMKSKPSNDLRSLHARVGGWVRDGNLDGVVELDMPKDYKLTPLALPRDQSIKPTITTSALNISPTANL